MTIKDIARLSGFSVGTVSRVMNNHPDVSELTRERVLAVVREQNFQPNANAKHLKQQSSTPISIIVKGTQNMLFADIIEQVHPLLRANGEEATVRYLDEDANEVDYALKVSRERRPKGFIFLGGNLEFFERDFDKISAPSVLLTNAAGALGFDNLSSLTTDDRAASSQAVDYLVASGHTNIGAVGGSFSRTQISFARLSGCRESCELHSIPFDAKKQHEPCRFSMAEGYSAAKRLLERERGITAIFAISDVVAIGVIRAIRDLGLRVPEDISVVGYDGVPISRYCDPRLTTVRQDTALMAKRGVEALLERLHLRLAAVHEKVPFELIEGESVCAPAK